jgi:hypothetical protein
MQDVATFADKCKVLDSWMTQIRKSIEFLKREVREVLYARVRD